MAMIILTNGSKGKSVIEFKDDYTVVDIQLTGLDPWRCEIIEIGAIKYRNGVERERYQTLCNTKKPLDEFVQNLTGITNDMLVGKPFVNDVIKSFTDFVGDDLVVGNMISMKANFIFYAAQKNGEAKFFNNFVDVSRIARKYFDNLTNRTTHSILEKCGFNAEEQIFHRAIPDCEHIHDIYNFFNKNIDNKENFLALFKAKKRKHNPEKTLKAKNIITTSDEEFDESSPIYDRVFCFTGRLDKMERRTAMQKVVDIGGKVSDGVTKKTNYLVIGNFDYNKSIKDGKSSKMKKAEKYKLEGMDIEVITEDVFYKMLNE